MVFTRCPVKNSTIVECAENVSLDQVPRTASHSVMASPIDPVSSTNMGPAVVQ